MSRSRRSRESTETPSAPGRRRCRLPLVPLPPPPLPGNQRLRFAGSPLPPACLLGREQLKALGFRCHHDERYWELGPRQFSAQKEQLLRTLLEAGELPAGSPRSPAVTPTKRRLGASGTAAFDAGMQVLVIRGGWVVGCAVCAHAAQQRPAL